MNITFKTYTLVFMRAPRFFSQTSQNHLI